MGKKRIIFMLRLILLTVIIDLALLYISESTEEWFSGGSGACSWKGNSTGVYNSTCIDNNSYGTFKCLNETDTCTECCKVINRKDYVSLLMLYYLFFAEIGIDCLMLIIFLLLIYNYCYSKTYKVCILESYECLYTILLIYLLVFGFMFLLIDNVKYYAGIKIRVAEIFIWAIMMPIIFHGKCIKKFWCPCLENSATGKCCSFINDFCGCFQGCCRCLEQESKKLKEERERAQEMEKI
jgi:hypothetical protein